MARTYTVHGHMERRDGRQEAFWTRTGLSKSAAQKLAREQRSESGGVARVVAEEGPAYSASPTRHHATKKSPAQLQREIDATLAGNGTSRGRHHSSISDSDKIRDAIARFPSTFGLRGFPGGVFRISPTSSYVSGGRVMLYTERKDNDDWLDFSKGTESELRSQVTSLAPTGGRSHSTASTKMIGTKAIDRDSAPRDFPKIVRTINSIIRAADGRNVYLLHGRFASPVNRISRARTKGHGMEVRVLASGQWIPVMPDDRIDVR